MRSGSRPHNEPSAGAPDLTWTQRFAAPDDLQQAPERRTLDGAVGSSLIKWPCTTFFLHHGLDGVADGYPRPSGLSCDQSSSSRRMWPPWERSVLERLPCWGLSPSGSPRRGRKGQTLQLGAACRQSMGAQSDQTARNAHAFGSSSPGLASRPLRYWNTSPPTNSATPTRTQGQGLRRSRHDNELAVCAQRLPGPSLFWKAIYNGNKPAPDKPPATQLRESRRRHSIAARMMARGTPTMPTTLIAVDNPMPTAQYPINHAHRARAARRGDGRSSALLTIRFRGTATKPGAIQTPTPVLL